MDVTQGPIIIVAVITSVGLFAANLVTNIFNYKGNKKNALAAANKAEEVAVVARGAAVKVEEVATHAQNTASRVAEVATTLETATSSTNKQLEDNTLRLEVIRSLVNGRHSEAQERIATLTAQLAKYEPENCEAGEAVEIAKIVAAFHKKYNKLSKSKGK
jgi:hypothetical protein